MGVLSTLMALSLGFTSAQAQEPNVDISLVDDGSGNLEVLIRPDAAFNGVFSALTFTVVWETASGTSTMSGTRSSLDHSIPPSSPEVDSSFRRR